MRRKGGVRGAPDRPLSLMDVSAALEGPMVASASTQRQHPTGIMGRSRLMSVGDVCEREGEGEDDDGHDEFDDDDEQQSEEGDDQRTMRWTDARKGSRSGRNINGFGAKVKKHNVKRRESAKGDEFGRKEGGRTDGAEEDEPKRNTLLIQLHYYPEKTIPPPSVISLLVQSKNNSSSTAAAAASPAGSPIGGARYSGSDVPLHHTDTTPSTRDHPSRDHHTPVRKTPEPTRQPQKTQSDADGVLSGERKSASSNSHGLSQQQQQQQQQHRHQQQQLLNLPKGLPPRKRARLARCNTLKSELLLRSVNHLAATKDLFLSFATIPSAPSFTFIFSVLCFFCLFI